MGLKTLRHNLSCPAWAEFIIEAENLEHVRIDGRKAY
jgi:hypothetical protein